MLESVCKQVKDFDDSGVDSVSIAVNISSEKFTELLVERLDALITQYEIAPNRITLEITEGACTRQEAAVDEEPWSPCHTQPGRLRNIGVNTLLDRRRIHVGLELLDIKIQAACIFDELRFRQLALIGEDQVVHLPELPLILGRL